MFKCKPQLQQHRIGSSAYVGTFSGVSVFGQCAGVGLVREAVPGKESSEGGECRREEHLCVRGWSRSKGVSFSWERRNVSYSNETNDHHQSKMFSSSSRLGRPEIRVQRPSEVIDCEEGKVRSISRGTMLGGMTVCSRRGVSDGVA